MKEIPSDLANICLRAGKKLKMKVRMKPLENEERTEIDVEAQCVDKDEN